MVTFCCTVACGSTFSTKPSNGRFGYASTVIVVRRPGWTLAMSVSSTSERICTVSRFAILNSTVPPPTSVVGEEITVPSSTFFVMIVPASGARSFVSFMRSRAFSRSDLALMTLALALA